MALSQQMKQVCTRLAPDGCGIWALNQVGPLA